MTAPKTVSEHKPVLLEATLTAPSTNPADIRWGVWLADFTATERTVKNIKALSLRTAKQEGWTLVRSTT